ncbi:MAG: hypothetical protein LUD47_05630 [Clostridia bacterium]|nr:hypothetical protein [Clostridia bacterium]
MIMLMSQLQKKYGSYSNWKGKIAREVACGNLTKVSHGIYETDQHTDGRYLAGYIFSPSYLSFDFALSEYDLIPEGVFCYSSATCNKRKTKTVRNAFGNFSYRDVPSAAYPKGLIPKDFGDYSYIIATPEKALCDKLYTMPPVRSVKDISDMLFEDLRVEEEDFWALDANDLLALAPLYGSNNLNCLAKLVKKGGVRR